MEEQWLCGQAMRLSEGAQETIEFLHNTVGKIDYLTINEHLNQMQACLECQPKATDATPKYVLKAFSNLQKKYNALNNLLELTRRKVEDNKAEQRLCLHAIKLSEDAEEAIQCLRDPVGTINHQVITHLLGLMQACPKGLPEATDDTPAFVTAAFNMLQIKYETLLNLQSQSVKTNSPHLDGSIPTAKGQEPSSGSDSGVGLFSSQTVGSEESKPIIGTHRSPEAEKNIRQIEALVEIKYQILKLQQQNRANPKETELEELQKKYKKLLKLQPVLVQERFGHPGDNMHTARGQEPSSDSCAGLFSS